MDKALDPKLMTDLFGTLTPAPVKKKVNFSSYRPRPQARPTPEVLAVRILRRAAVNPDVLGAIKERASVRWVEGFSDSLFDAVLCNFKPLNEQVHRDGTGKIILRSKTDWDEELLRYVPESVDKKCVI